MKILHTESSCGWGGQEIRTLTESEGMMERGHEVTIACPAHAKIYEAALKRGIPAVALPIQKKKLSSLWAMHQYLSANHFDVINTHSSTDSWLVSLCLAWKKHRPRIVRTRHLSTAVHNNRGTLWLYNKGNDFIVTTGEQLRQTLHSHNGIALEKMKSIPTGIDQSRFVPADNKNEIRQKLGLPLDKTIIGILATLRSWKGHEYLINAFAQLSRDDIHLLIVGDGPQFENVQRQVSELGISDRVTMPGNQENVVPWLQSMDIFCLPSYGNEGVPQGIMQAMLCRLPIISTDVGSILEVLHPGENGLLVKTKDVDSIRESLEILVNDSEKREQFARYSLDYALANCTKNKMVHDMELVFRGAD